jgi:hypothetical protein
MITDAQVPDTGSDLLDDARALVPPYERQSKGKVTLADVVIGVTQPGGLEGDEHLAFFGAVELNLFDAPLLVDVP